MSSDIKWIKIVPTIFDDEKIKIIEAMQHGDTILVIWFKLLAQAGKVNDKGLIYIIKNSPITTENLATIFNRPVEIVKLALETFEQFGMIETEEHINITNWELYQNIEGMEKIREQNRLRQEKFKQKNRNCEKENDNVTLTQCNVTDNVTDNVTLTQCNAPRLRNRIKNNILTKGGDNIKNININISSPNPPLTDNFSSEIIQENQEVSQEEKKSVPPIDTLEHSQEQKIEKPQRQPSGYFNQLRTVYNRYKNEGSMVGWQEFRIYEKDKSNPDVLSLIEDIEARSDTDQWRKGYIPSLAKYLKEKLWEQPLEELQDFKRSIDPEDFTAYKERMRGKQNANT